MIKNKTDVLRSAGFTCFFLLTIYAAKSQKIASDTITPRAMGIHLGIVPPGKNNAITDVAGVRVGHTTLIRGDSIRTGVTAILLHQGNIF